MKTARLGTLEIGRFFAALLVVLFHTTGTVFEFRGDQVEALAFRSGHVGVEYFFVLSGFIMYHIHRQDIGSAEAVRPFALKRFVRIFPVYWLSAAPLLAIYLAAPGLSGGKEMSILGGIQDLLLIPRAGNSETLLAVSWTLRAEIVFYLAFALIILAPRIGWAVFAIWQATVLVIGWVAPDAGPWATTFFGLHNIGFSVGIGVAWALHAGRIKAPELLALAGGALALVLMALEWWLGRGLPLDVPAFGRGSPLLYVPCAALILAGVVGWEARARPKIGGAWIVLGASSYLLYLTHTTVGSVLIRAAQAGPFRAIPSEIVFVAITAACVVAAVIGHLVVEKPLLAWLRDNVVNRQVSGGKSRQASTPSATAL